MGTEFVMEDFLPSVVILWWIHNSIADNYRCRLRSLMQTLSQSPKSMKSMKDKM